jgi:5-methylcytosine-specific restriction endonuclease McrA
MSRKIAVYSKLLSMAFQRDQGRCRYCERDLTGFADFVSRALDYFVQPADGGQDVAENVALCCSTCSKLLAQSNRVTTFEARKLELDRRMKEWRQHWEAAVEKLKLQGAGTVALKLPAGRETSQTADSIAATRSSSSHDPS